MRVLSWNLGHQTREAPIRARLGAALEAFSPDVVVLNEFVDGESRGPLREALAAMGLRHIHCSNRIGRHNQVFLASREECTVGDLKGPSSSGGAGESNMLHVRFLSGIELVGLRAPAYKGEEQREYWEKLSALIRSTSDRPIAWIGDLNADPDHPRSPGGKYLRALENEGWVLPRPSGEWSFYRGSRIDHVLASRSLACASAEYLTNLAGATIAGPSTADHVSDHAALVAHLSLRPHGEP